MLLAEDLLLLLYDEESGKPVVSSWPETKYVLAAAVLLELALAGKVDVTEKHRLVVRDAALTGDPVLEAGMPDEMVVKLSKNLRGVLLDSLAGKGILYAEKGRFLGLFRVTRWPALDTRHKVELRAALEDVLCRGIEPDQQTGALITLLHVVHAVPKVVTGAVDEQAVEAVERRAAQVAQCGWAADEVRQAVWSVMLGTVIAIDIANGAGTIGAG